MEEQINQTQPEGELFEWGEAGQGEEQQEQNDHRQDGDEHRREVPGQRAGHPDEQGENVGAEGHGL